MVKSVGVALRENLIMLQSSKVKDVLDEPRIILLFPVEEVF